MLKSIKRVVKNHPLVWRHYRNGRAARAFVKPELDVIQQGVVNGLKEKGIAFSSIEELIPQFDFPAFKKSLYLEIDKYNADSSDSKDQNKPYFDFILGLKPYLDKVSLWYDLASHPKFQEISDAYFALKGTEMRYYNIWRHRPSTGQKSGSQLWHRDREDVKILKIFVCIESVGDSNGPFTYAPGTHIEGHIKSSPGEFFEKGGTSRSTDEMMKKAVPQEDWIRSTGKQGTIVFADTHGYHKGGEVEEGQRVLFTAMYVSPACERKYFRT